MRKDVRLGFAVGGVLLAVIIVAVLVVHRNKNQGNKVALDLSGKTAAPSDGSGEVDVAPPQNSGQGTSQNQATQAPAEQSRRSGESNAAKPADAERPSSDSTGDAGDKWNQLFVSTADDPIKELAASGKKKAVQPDNSAQAKAPLAELHPDHEVSPGIESPVETRTVSSDPRPTTRPSSASTPRTHRVTQGETFVSIAKMIYGEERYFKAIERANPSVNPAKLRPGVVIQLPAKADLQSGNGKSSSAQPAAKATATTGAGLSADGSTYTVQSGDNLYKISRKLYGDGSKGEELYTANKDKIGSDSTRLKIGMVLRVPEKPAMAGTH